MSYCVTKNKQAFVGSLTQSTVNVVINTQPNGEVKCQY